MIITYKDFLIKPCTHSPSNFDVVRKVTKRKMGDGTPGNPQGEEYESETEIGYGYTLNSALEKVCFLLTEDGLKDQTIELKEYISEYLKTKTELKNYIEQILKVK